MVVGIDEVGRGPLAGPVCVGVFACTKKSLAYIQKYAPCKITDSKKMSAKNRQKVVDFLDNWIPAIAGMTIHYAIGSSSATYIDKYGIVKAIQAAMYKAIKKLPVDVNDVFLLDGGLKLLPIYKNQTTIIKGDQKELAISLASIVAKQYRDAFMCKLAKKYPGYYFENHVGYGTKAHYKAIKEKGVIKGVHRESFIL